MKEYALTVFSICLISAVLTKVSFGGKDDVSKIAVSVITLYVIISPLVSGIGNIKSEDIISPEWSYSSPTNGDYIKVSEEAFAKGVARAIEDRFSLKRESVSVRLFGFDFESMSAQKIKIILSGLSATADYRAVLAYAESMDIGECEVDIEIG